MPAGVRFRGAAKVLGKFSHLCFGIEKCSQCTARQIRVIEIGDKQLVCIKQTKGHALEQCEFLFFGFSDACLFQIDGVPVAGGTLCLAP